MLSTPIEKAIAFVLDSIITPALESAGLSPATKAKVRNSRKLLGQFTRVGDLLFYLRRFAGGASAET